MNLKHAWFRVMVQACTPSQRLVCIPCAGTYQAGIKTEGYLSDKRCADCGGGA